MRTGISASMRKVLGDAMVAAYNLDTFGALVHLYKNSIVPGPNSVLADFVEADFTGYAANGPFTNWFEFLNADTAAWGIENTGGCQFQAGIAPTPQVCYGWYLTNNAGNVLFAWGVFDTPFVVAERYDGIGFYARNFLLTSTGQSS